MSCEHQTRITRPLRGGAGPDEAAAELRCPDCGDTGWLYCDGTSSWRAVVERLPSPSPTAIPSAGVERKGRRTLSPALVLFAGMSIGASIAVNLMKSATGDASFFGLLCCGLSVVGIILVTFRGARW